MSIVQIEDNATPGTPLATFDLSTLEQEIGSLLHTSIQTLFPQDKTSGVDLTAILSAFSNLKNDVRQAVTNATHGTTEPAAPHPSSIKELLTEEFHKLEGVIATWRQDFTRNNQAWTAYSEEAIQKALTLPQVQDLAARAEADIVNVMGGLESLLQQHTGISFTVVRPDTPRPATPVAEPSTEPVSVPEQAPAE
jgi:hypothetical protein